MTEIIRKYRFIISLVLVLIVHINPAFAENIGVLMTGDIQYYREMHKAFKDELSDVLNEKRTNIVVLKPDPNPVSWVNSARKLIAIGSDLMVSYGSPATLTLLKETSDVPVLFAGVYCPGKMKINVNNATGMSSTVSVRDVINNLGRINKIEKLGILFNKYEKDSVYQAIEITGLAEQLELETVLINVKNGVNEEIFKAIDALLITSCSSCVNSIKGIIELTRAHRVTTAALIGGLAEKGVILNVSADPDEQGRELARIVRSVLNKVKLSEIPVKQPLKTEIIVNLKEAKALGFNVPEDVIKSATGVIK